ncbi:hypothetical protein ACI797_01255 [Geodermatophilus sp. SYSU D00691]
MEPNSDQTVGDYGYDEVHADVRRPAAPQPPPSREPQRPTPQRTPELDQDYGYDEAHSF